MRMEQMIPLRAMRASAQSLDVLKPLQLGGHHHRISARANPDDVAHFCDGCWQLGGVEGVPPKDRWRRWAFTRRRVISQ